LNGFNNVRPSLHKQENHHLVDPSRPNTFTKIDEQFPLGEELILTSFETLGLLLGQSRKQDLRGIFGPTEVRTWTHEKEIKTSIRGYRESSVK
jgi:hypothetical protein